MKKLVLVSAALVTMLPCMSAMAESNYNLAADREMILKRDQVNDLNPQGTMDRNWDSQRSYSGSGDQRRTRTRLRKGSGGSNSNYSGGGRRGGGGGGRR